MAPTSRCAAFARPTATSGRWSPSTSRFCRASFCRCWALRLWQEHDPGLIAGFLRPDAGTIAFGGRVVNDVPPHRRNIGMVFQSYALFPHLTVFENVAFGLRLRKLLKDQVTTAVRKVLDLVQLQHLQDRYPRQLSGGQQQRVALARASCLIRRCSCSMSRSRTSMRSCARRCASRSSHCSAASALQLFRYA